MRRGVLDQIPRSSLVLLLVGQAAVILPHFERLPWWGLPVWAGCVLWRVGIYQGRIGYPPAWLKGLLVVLSGAGVIASHARIYALEPAVLLLILAFLLKLLEMRSRRDALVVAFMGYFVIAAAFLFDQRLLLTLYELAAAWLITAALVGLHQSWRAPRPVTALRTAGALMAQALPLTVALFLLFPRMVPLWRVPAPTASAQTGLAEAFGFGDIASLSRSDDVAFRVEFDAQPPPRDELYWRALTYSSYRDGRWSQGAVREMPAQRVSWGDNDETPPWLQRVRRSEESSSYRIIAEPTHRPWLYALDFARPQTSRIGVGRDFRLMYRNAVDSRLRYRVRSWGEYTLDPTLPAWLRQRETALPVTGNPRTRALIERLGREVGDPSALIDALLRRFREQPFHYTLQPPRLAGDRMDGFLFDTRRGFCAHYAGSFVYMMRLANVPARVVAGYQGGERNPMGSYLVVRQYDAHAWAEVWLEGRGWVRVDPTAEVAPSRVERGLESALADGEASAASGSPFARAEWRRYAVVSRARYFVDALRHRWNMMVLNYDADTQNDVLQDLLGQATPARIASTLAGGGALTSLLAAAGALRGRRGRTRGPLQRRYLAFCRLFARLGAARAAHEPPGVYGLRLAAAFPSLAPDIERVTEIVVGGLYAGTTRDARRDARDVLRALIRIRLTTWRDGWVNRKGIRNRWESDARQS